MRERRAYVHEAELLLAEGADSHAPGGAVTVALCGRWDHEGVCRWPHNSAIEVHGTRARLRTVFAAPPDEEDEVRIRIDEGLATGDWRVVTKRARPVSQDERVLAAQLLSLE